MHMGDPSLASMLPFDSIGQIGQIGQIGLYEQPKPRFIFKMPRVVPDQKGKFEQDELFRRLGRESDVSTSRSRGVASFPRGSGSLRRRDATAMPLHAAAAPRRTAASGRSMHEYSSAIRDASRVRRVARA